MEKTTQKIFTPLRVFAAVATMLLVAILAVAASANTQAAYADEPQFANTPLCEIPGYESIKDAPGFEWVSADKSEDGVAYYRIFNPVDGFEGSHESGIGWWYFALYSRSTDFDSYLIRLDSDLSFRDYNFNRNGGDPNQLSVGSEDLPFSGTFDGCGHTISNLTNAREGLSIQMDNGFFGWTNKATIKNINFSNCYIGGSYRDGLVAGYAQDTFFLNILCEDCTTSVIPANNVLNLVTNAGISGGTIAGVANGCTLYNCEMRAGRVVTNATAGVAALGGQPLYMGGLVGQANDTTIEYSRVTDKWVDDGQGGKTRDYADVSGTYETAVSVANYSEVFVGGIVGGMQNEDTGSKIVDCYSTADVYGKVAIYFGVGLGLGVTRAYPGGIAGIVWAEGNGVNLIQRTHYAGNLHSYQYNQLLLGIPIIQEDAYLAGIVGVGGGNVKLDQAYFDRTASSTDNFIPVFQNWTTDTDGPEDGIEYGHREDKYLDRNFWEDCDFDFAGGTLRNVGYPFTPGVSASEWDEDHYNKWVMDYTRNMPVHGGSIKATMDFPGSGTVTIGETSLAPESSEAPVHSYQTTDPYDFAVQGYIEGDNPDANDDGNPEPIEITYAFTDQKNASWAADDQNQGFRFMGWYGSRDVQVNDLPQEHSLFTSPNSTLNTQNAGVGLIPGDTFLWQEGGKGSTPETLTVKYPAKPDNLGKCEYADNDLYVAYAQAQVLLHDVNGGLVNTSGETDTDTSDDWYNYEATITLPTSVPADQGQKGNFVGWTNKANTDDAGNDVGYTAIGSTELTALKENGQFWAPGETFTVTEPTNLYPIYSQYDNIDVIYEGHDAETLVTRTGYGTAAKTPDATTGDLILSVQPAENSPLLGGDPTVRFLGWYEYVGDATTAEAADTDPNATWLRVSRGEQDGDVKANKDCFTFNVTESGAGLTEPHIYKARFEYRVDYRYYEPDNDAWDYYDQRWMRYQDEFENITGPSYRAFKFLHWSTNSNEDDGVYQCETTDAYAGGPVTAPFIVWAHNEHSATGLDHVTVTTDFPVPQSPDDATYKNPVVSVDNSGIKIHTLIEASNCNTGDSTEREYWFHGWVHDSTSNGLLDIYDRWGTSYDNPFEYTNNRNALGGSHQYWVEAHVTTRVQFRGIPNSETLIVERRYEEPVRFSADSEYAQPYTKPFHFADVEGVDRSQTDGVPVGSTTAASPTDDSMARRGLVFLGWIDLSDTDVSAVADVIADQQDDYYLAKSYRSVAAYLMTGEEVCTRPMDLYPVYIEFDVDTTTNIAEAGVDTSTYNVPTDPSLVNEPIAESKGKVQVTFNGDDGATVSGTNAVNVDYNDAYEATVKVSVDNDQKIWTDASKEDVYAFTSLSVYRDGELAQTMPASGFADGGNGTLTTNEAIAIVAGCSYRFVANYSPVPVMVTYHYNYGGGGSTESFSTEVGQALPTPTGTPSFSGYESEFVVGWTEGDADGSPANYNGSPTILTPGSDVVTGTMHLWPVYRTGSFVVNSNIDDQTDPDDHRGWSKTTDGQSAELWAKRNVEVNGTRYTFQGWTTGGHSGEIERTSTTWTLYGNDRFPDPEVTYTAIYAQVSEIRYHNTDGSVIYTASVKEGDDRTFVNTVGVDVPQYDENGKPVIDQETGEQVTEKQEVSVPIDSQAFTAIAAAIDSKNAADNAESYEQFVTWQWVKSDGTTQRWGEGKDNFVNQTANENMSADGYMDLYPVTVKLTATDTTGAAYTGLTTQLTLDDEANTLTKAMITLQSSYNQEWLKVHIDEVAYAPDNKTVVAPQKSVPVDLYTPGSQIGSPVATDTTRDKSEMVSGVNLVEGDALFTFTGRITITKTATDARAAGQLFTFTISNDTDTRTVSLQLPEESTNGVYTKTVTVNVPFGNYTVTEDEGWAWRYDATVQHWELDSNEEAAGNQPGWVDGGNVTVEFDSTVSTNNPDGVTSAVQVNNALDEELGDKWFDGSDFKHNVFGKGGE